MTLLAVVLITFQMKDEEGGAHLALYSLAGPRLFSLIWKDHWRLSVWHNKGRNRDRYKHIKKVYFECVSCKAVRARTHYKHFLDIFLVLFFLSDLYGAPDMTWKKNIISWPRNGYDTHKILTCRFNIILPTKNVDIWVSQWSGPLKTT